ncbi:MAG: TPM domain-containing protein, partial [Treponema sp.]|nr:TPM domain-containing protein [Treponema sp.]
ADDFFDYNGYGEDGSLFLIVMESRDYWFSTSGRGNRILNTTAGNKLDADALKYLREADWYEACLAFLDDWDMFLALEAKGRSYNFFHQWNFVLASIAWLIALAIGFTVVQVWKKGMNTALPQTQAAAYVVSGSLVYREKKDSFLYSKVMKIPRQKQSSSGGGLHTGSSGRSHGGRGGKF